MGDLPKWFDTLKEKDKLIFLAELLPYCLPRLKQLDATIFQEPVKRLFPFGGYTNKDGKWVDVGDDAFFYDHPGGASRESVAAMFPPELKEGSNDHGANNPKH